MPACLRLQRTWPLLSRIASALPFRVWDEEMPRFACVCGAVTRDEEESPGATCVMYPRETLHAIEVSMADRLAEFVGLGDAVRESSWLASYFGRDYPSDLPKREVIEDIVTRELNGDFIGVFRCPACHRVAIKAEDSDRWKFYRAEPG